MKYVLAIDVAKNKSMAALIDSCGEVYIEPYEFNHTLSDFQKLKERIGEHAIFEADLVVFMESTSTYHYPVKRFFMEKTYYDVRVINPLHSSMHKRNLRKTKTDREDCYNLASLYFTDKVKNYNDHDGYYLNLNVLARQYDFLMQGMVKLKNRYRMLVNLCFPEYEIIFKSRLIFSDTALSFIEKFPHPDIIIKNRVDALANFMANLNGRHENFYLRKAHLIKENAKYSFPSVSIDDEIVNNLISTTRILKYQIKEIEELKDKLINQAEESYLFTKINSIYGLGEFTTALIIAELKDITRFNNIKELTAYCGLDPSIRQSGSSVNGKGHISKTGNSYIRRILFIAVSNIIMLSSRTDKENDILIYYRKKRNEGKHHYVSVIACTTKLLRKIFALCKETN